MNIKRIRTIRGRLAVLLFLAIFVFSLLPLTAAQAAEYIEVVSEVPDGVQTIATLTQTKYIELWHYSGGYWKATIDGSAVQFSDSQVRYGKTMCTSHKIEARELHRVVLEDIQRHAEMALQDDKKLLKRIVSKVDPNAQIELSALKKELRQAEKRLAELDRLFSKLYEDRLEEKISERNYLAMSSRYDDEQSRLDERCSIINVRLSENQIANDNAESWVDQIKEYAGITELSMPLLNALVERITVSEAEVIDGERRQTVNIYYKFIGGISE